MRRLMNSSRVQLVAKNCILLGLCSRISSRTLKTSQVTYTSVDLFLNLYYAFEGCHICSETMIVSAVRAICDRGTVGTFGH
jgi:hypothetical protein